MIFHAHSSRTGQSPRSTAVCVEATAPERTLERIIKFVRHACWSLLALGGFTLAALAMGLVFGQADASAAVAPTPPGSLSPPSTPTGTSGTPAVTPPGSTTAASSPATGTSGTSTAGHQGTAAAAPAITPRGTPNAAAAPAATPPATPNAAAAPGALAAPAPRVAVETVAGATPGSSAIGRTAGVSASAALAPANSDAVTASTVWPLQVAFGPSPVGNATVPVKPSPFTPAGPAQSSATVSSGGASPSSGGGPGVGLATFSVLTGLGLALLFIEVCADDFRRLTSSFYLVPLARPG